MLVHRRYARSLTLVCTTAALAVAPGAALAQPAIDPAPSKPDNRVIIADPAPAPIRTGGDTTLALIISGSALLIAAGGAGLAGRDHQRMRQII
jgi:hypothetical protein